MIFFGRGLRVFLILKLKPKVTQTVGSKTGSKITPKYIFLNQNQNRVPILRKKKRKRKTKPELNQKSTGGI